MDDANRVFLYIMDAISAYDSAACSFLSRTSPGATRNGSIPQVSCTYRFCSADT